jgi:hypothetical protein
MHESLGIQTTKYAISVCYTDFLPIIKTREQLTGALNNLPVAKAREDSP